MVCSSDISQFLLNKLKKRRLHAINRRFPRFWRYFYVANNTFGGHIKYAAFISYEKNLKPFIADFVNNCERLSEFFYRNRGIAAIISLKYGECAGSIRIIANEVSFKIVAEIYYRANNLLLQIAVFGGIAVKFQNIFAIFTAIPKPSMNLIVNFAV